MTPTEKAEKHGFDIVVTALRAGRDERLQALRAERDALAAQLAGHTEPVFVRLNGGLTLN